MAFKQAYQQLITIANSQAGFRRARLIPFDPKTVLERLDVKLQTPIPVGPPFVDTHPWVSQTSHNLTEALLQTTLVRDRIACY
jgi:hypothetical protein